MDINLLLGATGVLGMGAGVWALVFYRKNGNGKHLPPDPTVYRDTALLENHVPPLQLVPNEPVQVQWPPELAALLTHITERLETAIERVEHPSIVRAPSEQPEWVTPLLEELQGINERMINERMSEPASMVLPPELTAGLNRVTDRVEALLQLPPPRVELAELAQSLAQLPEELEKKFDRLARQIGVLLRAPKGTIPSDQKLGPTQRAPDPINLDIFNTVVFAENVIYELVPPEADIYNLSVMNLGPGVLYMSDNDTPAVDDPHSTTLPPGTGDNDIHTPRRVFALAGVGGVTASVRLNHNF